MTLGCLNKEAISRTFIERYQETWAYSPSGRPIQLVNLRVTAVGKGSRLELPAIATVAGRSTRL